MKGLTIGKLAKSAGIGIETVRFYEKQGLLDPPPRTESNYRIYPDEEIVKLRFIKRAKTLGFSLNEIKGLILLTHDPHATKADIKRRTDEKIKDIRQKIEDLTRMLGALEHLAGACDGHGPVAECPIIEALVSDIEDESHQH
ncbi:MAG: MerR family DNA-binding protein [Proteobacteria bacterium]|nr:MerR family DNA-binding protein [Pseudomonadota bacterium]MBU1711150.1 MerR family DNA-binding protein [Pseudomonadota bacterium]